MWTMGPEIFTLKGRKDRAPDFCLKDIILNQLAVPLNLKRLSESIQSLQPFKTQIQDSLTHRLAVFYLNSLYWIIIIRYKTQSGRWRSLWKEHVDLVTFPPWPSHTWVEGRPTACVPRPGDAQTWPPLMQQPEQGLPHARMWKETLTAPFLVGVVSDTPRRDLPSLKMLSPALNWRGPGPCQVRKKSAKHIWKAALGWTYFLIFNEYNESTSSWKGEIWG